ncbi:hypothetical protein L916_10833, partial [Phytophthora nicotianae]
KPEVTKSILIDRGTCGIDYLNCALGGILGDKFLREYYTVFNFHNLEIGIACGGVPKMLLRPSAW